MFGSFHLINGLLFLNETIFLFLFYRRKQNLLDIRPRMLQKKFTNVKRNLKKKEIQITDMYVLGN